MEILRFVITIRSGKASASQLFKRLNSYSKSPLYDAIKEFGKVIRTIFVLRYIDELEYRKRIQKQLNLGEQANSFFKAVFWARGHRLRVNRPGDEERYLLSAQLLQSCVILWNYLYVTKAIINMTNLDDRDTLLMQLKKGQMLTWKHINFSGEFDFRKYMVQTFEFDRNELEAFQVA
jgi:TnpA family transposase